MRDTSPLLPHVRLAWRDRLAAAVTYVISPLSLPPLLFGLVVAHFGAPAREVGWTMLGAFVLLGVIPTGYLAWMVRRGYAPSLEVRDRTPRGRAFLAGIAAYAAALALVLMLHGTAAVLVAALVACIVVNGIVLALITLRWKISIHAVAVAAFVAALLFVALAAWPGHPAPGTMLRPATVGLLLPLIPLVMWARVRVGAHTWGQVWAGAFFGFFALYAELMLLSRLGLFDDLY